MKKKISLDWKNDDTPYRKALAHAMTLGIDAMVQGKKDITDDFIKARNAVDREVEKILRRVCPRPKRDKE